MDDLGDLPVGLVADIGGTNARFALTQLSGGPPRLMAPQNFLCRDFDTAEAAVEAYLATRPAGPRPVSAVLAVAGPIINGEIAFTNTDWRISERDFRAAMKLNSAKLVNDYAALATAAPLLQPDETTLIGPDLPGRPDGSVLILGAGTGFGVSALVRSEGREAILTTEGGHVSFAPTTELEVEVWRYLSRQFSRVSVERILSGPGLLNLYQALCSIEGVEPVCATPGDVTRRGRKGDATAERTLNLFCDVFGCVAGDFALAYGAQGGVFIAGGVSKHLADILTVGAFRDRFEDKGRFRSYLAAIPTRLILHAHTVALIGAARTLQQMQGVAP